jgi:flagellar protein FlgJ
MKLCTLRGRLATASATPLVWLAAAAAPTDRTAAPAGGAATRLVVAGSPARCTAAARELGVDPRAIVAQAALETGWGTSKPADAGGNSHNFFGIKAGANWQGRTVSNATTEYVAGEAGTERARFRAYSSLAENVGDYVRVIRDNPRYAAALGTGADVRAFANALQRGGYATDPQYADKLVATFEKVTARQDIAAGTPADVKRFKSADATPIPAQELSNG